MVLLLIGSDVAINKEELAAVTIEKSESTLFAAFQSETIVRATLYVITKQGLKYEVTHSDSVPAGNPKLEVVNRKYQEIIEFLQLQDMHMSLRV